ECVDGEALTADYWWDNMRNPVLFDPALRQLLQAGHKLLLEVGGHPVLSPYLKKTAAEAGAHCFTSQHRKQPQQHYFRQNLAALYRAGATLRWPARLPGSLRVTFPAYPWQRVVAINESLRSLDDRLRGNQRPLLGSRIDAPDPSWQQELDSQRFGWLQDHQVMSRTVFPAAGYIEAALQASVELQQHPSALLENLSFRRLCMIAPEGPTLLRVRVQPAENRFTLYSSQPSVSPAWTTHADGQLLAVPRLLRRASVDVAALRQRCRQPFSGDLSARFAELGLEYGPAFSLISAIHTAGNELLLDIRSPDARETAGYLIHPALLDASFQSLLALLPEGQGRNRALLPVLVRRVLLYAPASSPLLAHVRCNHLDAQTIEGDITLFDHQGQVCLEIGGLQCAAVTLTRPDPLAGKLWHWQWQPVAAVGERETRATVVSAGPEERCPGSPRTDFWQAVDTLVFDGSPIILCPPGLSNRRVASDRLASALLQFSRLVGAIARQQPALTVVMVTHNALSLPAQQAEVNLFQAAFWGMVRTLASEWPQLDLRLLDSDCDLSLAAKACATVLTLPARGEYALRRGALLRHAFAAFSSADLQRLPQREFDDNGEQRIVLPSFTAGDPAVSPFCLVARAAPADDEVEIGVLAAALRPQGGCHEVSGTVLRAGDRSGFRVGQRVVALAAHPLCASHLTLRVTPGYANSALILLPASGSPLLHDPCLLPVMIAIACLRQRARLLAGDTVLIIGDLPGEVQAAIDLARTDGATVLVVSHGAEHLRAFRQQGADAVFDSNDPLWLRAVQAWLGQTAVSVLLNFAPQIAEERLLPLLADFGTLIDLCPGNSEVATRQAGTVKTNLSRLSVDCLAMQKTSPGRFSQLAQLASDALQTGDVQRVPPLAFSAERIHFALTHTRENHSALRVVLQFAGKTLAASHREASARISPQASYLVTGGVRGLGFHLAGWLVTKGAKELILVGRQGILPDAQQAQVQQWQARGVRVHIKACDISDAQAVTALLEQIAAACLPLKGIIHCAAQVDDAFSDRLSQTQLQHNLAAKVAGAWHLHHASAALPLDWLLLSSSVSSVFGNPGQAGYAAANTALEALGQLRQQQQKPTVTINWGAIEGAGMVADRPELAAHFRHAGIGLLPLTLIDSLMEQVLNGESHQLTLADISWPVLAESIGIKGGGTPFDGVLAGQITDSEPAGEHLQRLSALPVAQRADYIAEHLMQLLRRVVGGREQALSLSQSTSQFGLDSLMYLEFQVQIKRAFQVTIPASELLTGASLRELAETVNRKAGLTLQVAPVAAG
ncbi:SDR family NAD(P)-dependent oxidoreductase, partial [Erwinia sp. B116]|uniref:SDR family NAD(P)-dependent oxidoreductase n=1 Tax=Erwinia sp. B116 TaxID=1561024 RepID=UPI000CBD2544